VTRRRCLLLTVALAATLSGWSTVALADLTPTPTPTSATGADRLPVGVTLTGLTPLAPQPGDDLVVRRTLSNQGVSPVANLAVHLVVSGTKIGDRGQFRAYAATPDGPAPSDAAAPASETSVLSRTQLDVADSEPFSITVPVDDLSLPEPWQVYEMAIVVSADTVTGNLTVGQLRTFLPWAPLGVPGVGQPTQLAWVWPIVDRPHRSDNATWTDDALATSIAPGGRLADLMAAGIAAENQTSPPPPRHKPRRKARPTVPVSSVPVTWTVDPLLVEDLTKMAAGYKVGRGRDTSKGAGSDDAKARLRALADAAAKSEVLSLPYADPDLTAATRGGTSTDAGLAAAVQAAINSGTTLVSQALSTTPLPYIWPPAGLIDQRTLDTLFAARVSTVVLDGAALPPLTPPSVTPNAHATVRARDGNLDALLTDSGLSTVVGIGAREPDKGPLAIQRFLAETLMIQAEQPSYQRTLVVAPERRWAPSAAYATALLTDTGKVPWIEPVPLSRALAAAATPTVTRAPLNYPALARRAELPQSYLSDVRTLKSNADRFAEILPPGDAQARSFDDAVVRTLSSSWRGHRADAASYRSEVAAQLAATMHKVRIASPNGSFVTLTSHSGTVPVTVANELDTPVSVIVAISSQHLKLSGQGRKAQIIPAHRQIAVDVRATARTSGVFPLTVRLLTRSGAAYDDPEQLFVRSTAYGTVAILITAGATGALLIAVAIRLIRRALAARRSAVEQE